MGVFLFHTGRRRRKKLNSQNIFGKLAFVCRYCLFFFVVVIEGQSCPTHKELKEKVISMKFMLLVKANKDTEAGVKPSPELLEAFMKYNEELTRAGVLIAPRAAPFFECDPDFLSRAGEKTEGDRRTVHRGKGTDRGVYADRREVAGRNDPVGVQDAGSARFWRRRDRSAPDFRIDTG